MTRKFGMLGSATLFPIYLNMIEQRQHLTFEGIKPDPILLQGEESQDKSGETAKEGEEGGKEGSKESGKRSPTPPESQSDNPKEEEKSESSSSKGSFTYDVYRGLRRGSNSSIKAYTAVHQLVG